VKPLQPDEFAITNAWLSFRHRRRRQEVDMDHGRSMGGISPP
jgi:hypothetical protein